MYEAHRKISVPYEQDFNRTKAHYSNFYFGASLAAIVYLANQKGYSFVGTNSAGVNAFFVRNDLVNDKLKVLDVQSSHFVANFREGRDEKGALTYLKQNERLKKIQGLPVMNIEDNCLEMI